MKNDDPVYPYVEELRRRVAVMRELRVLKWGDIELAPEALITADEQPDTQPRKLSPEEEEQRRRNQQRAVALRTSGGPVPRLSVGAKQ